MAGQHTECHACNMQNKKAGYIHTFQGVQPQLYGAGFRIAIYGCNISVTINQENLWRCKHTWLVLQV
jgi:hypothetical protein